MIIEKKIINLLKKIGVSGTFEFTAPPNPEMGDLAFACFDLAKEMKLSPVEVAKDIVNKLRTSCHSRHAYWQAGAGGNLVKKNKIPPDIISGGMTALIDKVEATGPYVNFYLKTAELADLVLPEVEKKNFGENNIGKNKKVLIEYPSQNTHKEFHVGHLRNACIGNSMVGLMRKSNYKVIPINYINDFGAHVVKCLWYIEKFSKQAPVEDKQKWLGEIYAEANNYIKEHKEVETELAEYQKKLESKDPEVMKLFQETKQWSIEGFDKIHHELGIEHKEVFFESEIKKKGQKIVDKLLKKKIAEVGERGAIIVDLNKYNLDIALLRKATGAGLYITSDLALAEEKFKKIKVDESINITGTEQNFYFKQLFKILELSGFKNKLTHIGYGLVNRPDGKMSSRLGNVILYEDLRDEIYTKLFQETQKRHEDWSEDKIVDTTKILTQAILKFTMLKHEAEKNVTFDIKEAVSIEGFSAPYVLYSVARINSLIKKAEKLEKRKIDYSLLDKPEEKKLILQIANYGKMIEKAWGNYNPSVMIRYCFELAQSFNDFYNKQQIIDEENIELTLTRLALARAVHDVLVDALNILSIKTVEEM